MSTAQDEQLLDRVSDTVFARLNAGIPISALPWAAQVIAIIYSAQGVIENGGLSYFLASDWPEDAPYSVFVQAYQAIGAEQVAEAIALAAARFPFPAPHQHREARGRYMEQHWEDEFAGLEDQISGRVEGVFPLLAAFACRHQAELAAALYNDDVSR